VKRIEVVRIALGAFFCILAPLLSAGCHSATETAPGVNVVIEGPGTFPASVAGRWRADRDGWEFVFDSEGHIVSAVLGLGRVEVTPGHAVTLPTRSGGESVFEPGQWTVHYVPRTQQFTVNIALDHVRIDMAGTILEGRSTDVFSGAIAPADGVWQVQWTAFSRYTVQAPDQPPQELSTDETYGETKALTFQKVPEE
jgi:hypothetical protein